MAGGQEVAVNFRRFAELHRAARIRGNLPGKMVVVILCVDSEPQSNLFEQVNAINSLVALFRRHQRR